jgi:hypothetical protein
VPTPWDQDWDQLLEAALRKVRASTTTYTSAQDAKLTAEAVLHLAQATKALAEAEEIRRRILGIAGDDSARG